MHRIVYSLLLILSLSCAGAQPGIQWQKAYGGSNYEYIQDIKQTNDGGFIATGFSASTDGDIADHIGQFDVWVIKTDASGSVSWSKSYGGSLADAARRIIQTQDGGYIMFGETWSNDGDITMNHGIADIWVVKLTATGDISWQRSYGGSDEEWGTGSISQTADGGYIFMAQTESSDGDVSGKHSGVDIWVVKTDAGGNIVWQKCYGGSLHDYPVEIIPLDNGNYLLAGGVASGNGDVTGNHGKLDAWVCETDNDGNILWQKCFGGSENEDAYDLLKADNGNFYLTGYSYSNDGDLSGHYGSTSKKDIWVLKFNSTGSILWSKYYGGTEDDGGHSIVEGIDGNLIVSAITSSNDGDISGTHGDKDIWLAALNPNSGSIAWSRTLGGSGEENDARLIETTDGGTMCGALTLSTNGNAANNGLHGLSDYWLVKVNKFHTDMDNNIGLKKYSAYPTLTNGDININTGSDEILSISVVDIAGKIVPVNVTGSGSSNRADLRNVSYGTYVIKIKTAKGTEAHRILYLP